MFFNLFKKELIIEYYLHKRKNDVFYIHSIYYDGIQILSTRNQINLSTFKNLITFLYKNTINKKSKIQKIDLFIDSTRKIDSIYFIRSESFNDFIRSIYYNRRKTPIFKYKETSMQYKSTLQKITS